MTKTSFQIGPNGGQCPLTIQQIYERAIIGVFIKKGMGIIELGIGDNLVRETLHFFLMMINYTLQKSSFFSKWYWTTGEVNVEDTRTLSLLDQNLTLKVSCI